MRSEEKREKLIGVEQDESNITIMYSSKYARQSNRIGGQSIGITSLHSIIAPIYTGIRISEECRGIDVDSLATRNSDTRQVAAIREGVGSNRSHRSGEGDGGETVGELRELLGDTLHRGRDRQTE
jgi:hypothetical protein